MLFSPQVPQSNAHYITDSFPLWSDTAVTCLHSTKLWVSCVSLNIPWEYRSQTNRTSIIARARQAQHASRRWREFIYHAGSVKDNIFRNIYWYLIKPILACCYFESYKKALLLNRTIAKKKVVSCKLEIVMIVPFWLGLLVYLSLTRCSAL